MSHDDTNTAHQRSATGHRARPSRAVRTLGWAGLAVGFVLLLGTLSKLLAPGDHSALGMTLEIVLAVIGFLLIAQGADGVRPGAGRRGRPLHH